MITGSTSFDPAIELELVNALLDSDVSALIAASVHDSRLIARLCAQARTPLVWVHNTPDPAGLPLVGSDQVSAGRLAAEHLLTTHQREQVAFVGGFQEHDAPTGDREAVRDRYRGYTSVYGERVTQITTDLTLDGAYHAVRAALEGEAQIDGLIIGTYSQSPAVLRAVADAGLQIPHDIVVITFDGDPRSSYAPITLTSIQQDVELIASTALALVHGAAEAASANSLSVSLKRGESCGCRSW
jgi:LacI family transcriptional regulator